MGTHSPLPKGAQPSNFRPMSIVAKRSPISATAEHLLRHSVYYVTESWNAIKETREALPLLKTNETLQSYNT